MRILVSCLATVLLISLNSPTEAGPIVFGDFSGVVTSSSGGGFPFAVGDPVFGTFEYGGNNVSHLFFSVDINGKPFVSYNFQDGLSFTVDAAGLPVFGSAAGDFDLSIEPGGNLGFNSFMVFGGTATVTYEITGIPDGCMTSTLMGIAFAGLALCRTFCRSCRFC